MAEYACILLVSGRIGTDFTKLHVIFRIGRLHQHDAVLRIELFLYAFKSFFCLAVIDADSCHDAHALRLDEDLTLFAYMAANRMTIGIKGTQEPVTIPASAFHGANHFTDMFLNVFCLFMPMEMFQ